MERYLPRQLSEQIQELIAHFPCVVITGARQVGKSTLLKELFPDYNYVLFDPVEDVENARLDPSLFLRNRPTPLILDEIQYAPEVVAAVKRAIDHDRKPGQFILTGSQQWGVMKNLADSLAGRAIIVELDPFSLGEIAKNPPKEPWFERWLQDPENFSCSKLELPYVPYECIWRGFFPEAQFLPLKLVHRFHAAYQKTYVERDMRQMANVSNLQLFTRFIRLVAALTAQEINYNQLGRDIDIDGTTAKRWLMILRETFEWHEIPAFSRNMVKRVSLKSKGYFADTGQVCFSQAVSTPHDLPSHPLWGAIFENAVVNEVRKQCSWMSAAPNLYHWRVHSGAECDLIAEWNGKYYPIEIKATSHPKKQDASGIAAFRKSYPSLNVQRGVVICFTESPVILTPDTLAIPWNI
ncbi:MAG: ATP-binding protein [Chlamydiales bacterium]|nr:ATP-binding protein [Chlamydiales bacterium]